MDMMVAPFRPFVRRCSLGSTGVAASPAERPYLRHSPAQRRRYRRQRLQASTAGQRLLALLQPEPIQRGTILGLRVVRRMAPRLPCVWPEGPHIILPKFDLHCPAAHRHADTEPQSIHADSVALAPPATPAPDLSASGDRAPPCLQRDQMQSSSLISRAVQPHYIDLQDAQAEGSANVLPQDSSSFSMSTSTQRTSASSANSPSSQQYNLGRLCILRGLKSTELNGAQCRRLIDFPESNGRVKIQLEETGRCIQVMRGKVSFFQQELVESDDVVSDELKQRLAAWREKKRLGTAQSAAQG